MGSEGQDQHKTGGPARVVNYSCPAMEHEPGPVDPPAFNFLAPLALACGLVSLTMAVLVLPMGFGLTANWVDAALVYSIPIGLILAVLSLFRRGKFGRWQRPMAFTALAMVAVSMIAVPATMGRASPRGNRIKCGNNLRTIGQMIWMYADDYGGRYPSRLDVLMTVMEVSPELFCCPSSDDMKATGPTTQAVLAQFNTPGYCSYIYLGAGLTTTTATAQTVVAYESVKHHENEGMNVLYGDYSVQWVARAEAEHIISELKAGRNPPATRPAK